MPTMSIIKFIFCRPLEDVAKPVFVLLFLAVKLLASLLRV